MKFVQYEPVVHQQLQVIAVMLFGQMDQAPLGEVFMFKTLTQAATIAGILSLGLATPAFADVNEDKAIAFLKGLSPSDHDVVCVLSLAKATSTMKEKGSDPELIGKMDEGVQFYSGRISGRSAGAYKQALTTGMAKYNGYSGDIFANVVIQCHADYIDAKKEVFSSI